MKSYAESEVFSDQEISLWNVATKFVAGMPSKNGDRYIRCHELAWVTGKRLGLDVQVGIYHIGAHSWLWVPSKRKNPGTGKPYYNILDVYVPGQLPQVQLIDMAATLPCPYKWASSSTKLTASLTFTLRQDDIDLLESYW